MDKQAFCSPEITPKTSPRDAPGAPDVDRPEQRRIDASAVHLRTAADGALAYAPGESLERLPYEDLASKELPSESEDLEGFAQAMMSRMGALSCAASDASSDAELDSERRELSKKMPDELDSQWRELSKMLEVGEKRGWPRKKFKPGSIIHAVVLDEVILSLLTNTTFLPMLKKIGVKVVASKDPDRWYVIDLEMSDDKQDYIKRKIASYWADDDDGWELAHAPGMVEIVVYNGTTLEATEENAAHVHSKLMLVLAQMRRHAAIEASPEFKKLLDHHELLERAREMCDDASEVLSSYSGTTPSTLSEIRRQLEHQPIDALKSTALDAQEKAEAAKQVSEQVERRLTVMEQSQNTFMTNIQAMITGTLSQLFPSFAALLPGHASPEMQRLKDERDRERAAKKKLEDDKKKLEADKKKLEAKVASATQAKTAAEARAAEAEEKLAAAEAQAAADKKKLEDKAASATQERDSLKQERDSLKQERDSLKKERDSLKKERDSLKKERDAAKGVSTGKVAALVAEKPAAAKAAPKEPAAAQGSKGKVASVLARVEVVAEPKETPRKKADK